MSRGLRKGVTPCCHLGEEYSRWRKHHLRRLVVGVFSECRGNCKEPGVAGAEFTGEKWVGDEV